MTAALGTELISTQGDTVRSSSIREIYRELLTLAESHGVQRPPATTPFEHLPSLKNSLEPADSVEDLTTAYVDVRYAERDASSNEVEAAREQLEHLHARTP